MERIIGLFFAIVFWPIFATILMIVGPFIWVYALLRSLTFFGVSMLLHAIASRRLYASARVLEDDILWYPQRIREAISLLKAFATGDQDTVNTYDDEDDEYSFEQKSTTEAEGSLTSGLWITVQKFLAFIITQLLPATFVWIGIYFTFLALGIDLSVLFQGDHQFRNIAIWCVCWLALGLLGIALMPLVRTILVVPFVVLVSALWTVVGFVFWVPRLIVAFIHFFLKSMVYMFVSGRTSSPMIVITRAFYYYLRGYLIIFSILTNTEVLSEEITEDDIESERAKMLKSLFNSVTYLAGWIPLIILLAVNGWLLIPAPKDPHTERARTQTVESLPIAKPPVEGTGPSDSPKASLDSKSSSEFRQPPPDVKPKTEPDREVALRFPKRPSSIEGYRFVGYIVELDLPSFFYVDLGDEQTYQPPPLSRGDQLVLIDGMNSSNKSVTGKVSVVFADGRIRVLPESSIGAYKIGMSAWKKNPPIAKGRDAFESDTPPAPVIIEAVPIQRVAPRYPSRAARAGIEGAVTLRFTITKFGLTADTEVVSASPKGWGFEEASLDALRQWRYSPRTENGQPVETIGVETEFKFTLTDSG